MLRILFFLVILVGIVYVVAILPLNTEKLPLLKTGDIIVQTSTRTKQSPAISWATKSRYSHIGMIEVRQGKYFVLEAGRTVQSIPLTDWVERGFFHRFAIFRYPDLSASEQRTLLHQHAQYEGSAYDMLFMFNNEKIYCSELIYLLFQAIKKPIGKVEPMASLDVDNILVKYILQERWQQFPFCNSMVDNFETCFTKILKMEVVTPKSIIDDRHLKEIYNNYGW